MLKITVQSKKQGTKLTLEGRLAGPWVEELARCWRQIVEGEPHSVTVDLTGVTFIEPQAKALLTRMWREGAEFHAAGCLTRCIIEDITKAEEGGALRASHKAGDKRS